MGIPLTLWFTASYQATPTEAAREDVSAQGKAAIGDGAVSELGGRLTVPSPTAATTAQPDLRSKGGDACTVFSPPGQPDGESYSKT